MSIPKIHNLRTSYVFKLLCEFFGTKYTFHPPESNKPSSLSSSFCKALVLTLFPPFVKHPPGLFVPSTSPNFSPYPAPKSNIIPNLRQLAVCDPRMGIFAYNDEVKGPENPCGRDGEKRSQIYMKATAASAKCK